MLNQTLDGTDIQNIDILDSDLYRVCWKNKETGATGHGEPIPKVIAAGAVKAANLLYPYIHHWIIQA